MDQRSICLFLAMKGLSAREVHDELVAVLGRGAIAYSTVTSYPRQWQFSAISSEPSDESPTTIIDGASLDALDKQPFSSVRELTKLTSIPTTTVYRRLTRSLGFVVKHLRCVPHTLTDTQKAEAMALSNQLLLEMRSIKHQGWHFIITLDKLWFSFSRDHEQIWFRPDQEPPEWDKHTIQDKKIMVTIAWNALGFDLVEDLPKGRRFNAKYYRNNILTELIRIRPRAGERNLVIHADNASLHTAQKCRTFCAENGMRLATHPPYSPDLALSDFFLFGYVKDRLQGILFASREELVAGISEVLDEIRPETLPRVFEHWIERLEWISQNNGEYYR
jgi:transposase